ncbi:DUF3305 domain-containing protein [Hydrogenophaga sp.]|uniref:DUF3305 domain-containing protein n=1 Tax=Hydrogenophaga sp. TaxID=1904254 RepID=UPI0027211E2E|nr:DUF3305 domain-containing protein [Hydrogenophaga sp.]MDO9132757.1 DUF3305 domain-containing protein [Hydrogenophaga sp.]
MNNPHTPAPNRSRPAIEVDVVMRREPVVGDMSRWQPFRWVLADVMPRGSPDETEPDSTEYDHEPLAVEPVDVVAGTEAGGTSHWLFPRFRVMLFSDDAEGYFLNLNSPNPCFWVFWRADEERLLDGEPMAVPQIVTLSYHDAGRWLDAQERVDQVPAAPEVVDWLRGFVDATYQPEPKRRQRPQSFQALKDRFGQPVRVTTDKLRGGGQPSGQ